MPETPRRLKVFLCHSSNDKPAVRALYQKLSAEAWIDPWLDEEKLLPGQDWDMEIEKAVRETDSVVVCLSNNSVTKEGYVQHEMRLVLRIAGYKPEGVIFVVPIRLDDCPVPMRFELNHYVDFFPPERRAWAYGRLLTALQKRAESLGIGIVQRKNWPQASAKSEELVRASGSSQPQVSEVGSSKIGEKSEIPEQRSPQEEVFSGRSGVPNMSAGVKMSLSGVKSGIKGVKTPITGVRTGNRGVSVSNEGSSRPIPIGKQLASAPPAGRLMIAGMEFCHIPAGKFIMGSKDDDPEANDSEKPQHLVNIPYDYWLARFTVTNDQYNAFIQSSGGNHTVPNWENKPDHPVVSVSWEDAQVYVKWLNEFGAASLPKGYFFRLPTEAEWEKSARGTDGRVYPWGNEFDPQKCNSAEGKKGTTTPVGTYSPLGDSPYGCADLCGNVWEWTHSLFAKYPYKAEDGRENEQGFSGYQTLVGRTVRGGFYHNFHRDLRVAYRIWLGDILYRRIGFRVALAPPLKG
jgi:formylglycine-generating enzyme required for sulfatase activity